MCIYLFRMYENKIFAVNDANGMPSSGVQLGKTAWLGCYECCMQSDPERKFEAKYCKTQFINTDVVSIS